MKIQIILFFSHISKFFPAIPNTSEKQSENISQNNSIKEKMQKNKCITLSDDDGDFESPKVPKKKLIKWELTKTKVYSKKTSKSKKPITNSTIKIIEDNFKDIDVNPEHLQMGIMLSKSSYETDKQSSQHPLEETPDMNLLTGNILERFGFKSDKPVNRFNLNVPTEKSKKRKFRYTTPILISRTESDRESLLTANISLILSKNTNIQNVRTSTQSSSELFSKKLQTLWCKSGRLFCLNIIYENEKFTVEELNLSSNKPRCGCLLRKWSSIPAINEESDSLDITDHNQHPDSENCLTNPSDAGLASQAEQNLGNILLDFSPDNGNGNMDSLSETIKSTALSSLAMNSPTLKYDKNFENISSDLSSAEKRVDTDSSKQTTTETAHSSPSPMRKRLHRSITPDLFTSDNELSFTKRNNDSSTLEKSLEVVNHNPIHDNDDDEVIIIDDDVVECSFSKISSTESRKVLSPCFDSPQCSTKSIHVSVRKTIKYSFDSDSDDQTDNRSKLSSPTNEFLSKSPIFEVSRDSVIDGENIKSNVSYTKEDPSSSKALSPCFDSPQIIKSPNIHTQTKQDNFEENCSNHSFRSDFDNDIKCSELQDSIGKVLTADDSEEEEDADKQICADDYRDSNNESSKFRPNKFFDASQLNVTDYINNMLNSQEETFTTNHEDAVINTNAHSSINIEITSRRNGSYFEAGEDEIIPSNYDNKSDIITTSDLADDDVIYEVEEVFSQASQSDSFIDELNRTDFCYIPPAESEKFSRNSTGESGFWSQGRTSSDEIVEQHINKDELPVPSTSNEKPITNLITPDKAGNTKVLENIMIKTNNVTPMQDYAVMNTPTINKELDKYGIKPLKRTRGAALLKYIYESTHPIVDEGGGTHDSDEENRVVKKQRSKELFPGSQAASGIEIVGDLLLQNEEVNDLIFERKQSVRIHSCRVPLQIVWHNLVSSDHQLKENILLYEPLELEILHQSIKQLGYRFHLQDLLTFLDKKCITVRIKR